MTRLEKKTTPLKVPGDVWKASGILYNLPGMTCDFLWSLKVQTMSFLSNAHYRTNKI
jgi:hypothetical protein